MCSISVCSLKLRPFIVWKLWPGQKFKVKSVLFQKSGADNFRTQTAIQILRPRCTTRHQGDSLWQVSNNYDGNCRRSCAHKKLLTDGRTDRQTDDRGYNVIRPFMCIKMLVTSIFSFLHNVFHPSMKKFWFFSHPYFIICKGQGSNFIFFYQLANFCKCLFFLLVKSI